MPLFVKRPWQSNGAISDRPIELVDVVPTIADVLRLARPWSHLDGTSALSDAPSNRAERALYGVDLTRDGREKYAAVEHKYRRFGHDGGSIDIFEMAPGNLERLLDRRIRSFVLSDRAAATIRLSRGRSIPPLIEGTVVDIDKRAAPQLAIAVKRRMVAVTKSYEAEGEVRFSALLPPRTWSRSWDDLQVFVVSHRAAGIALHPVETEE